MKKIFVYITIVLSSCGTLKAPVNTPELNQKAKDAQMSEMLVGHCSRTCLMESPYKEWFVKNYEEYIVDTITAEKLKTLLKDKTLVVFMGTWCGDSRREVPGLIKLMDHCQLSDAQLKLVMLDYREGAYKQSPQHEEKGKNIFRVPSFLVYSENREIGRIVEFPRQGIEKDLLEILTGHYEPNYAAGNWLMQELAQRSLKKLAADTAAIAARLKPWLRNAAEANSIGHVFLDRGEKGKSLFVFEMNSKLYPAVIGTWNGLAKAYVSIGEKEKAKLALAKATSIDANNQETKRLLELLK